MEDDLLREDEDEGKGGDDSRSLSTPPSYQFCGENIGVIPTAILVKSG